jgi:DNA polymerase-3 subunit chi
MTDLLFYHLQRWPLEQVLPVLLQKTLANNWRAVVRTDQPERVQGLSDALWKWRDNSFIAHGSAGDGNSSHQPIWITAENENPNNAQVLFYVDGVEPDEGSLDKCERVVVMFSGRNDEALAWARDLWRRLKKRKDLQLTYWQQGNDGHWKRRDG